ncbi:hypothetical protein LMG28727_07159 [Paraburkholderia kirstenboschensis]|uniref:hypothetical protein n=1 Tax=Paraburkholderia kirstenboschensis TaxID=1245436 RepID=UPI000AFA0A92|nr:hypothetical protein [Paraburkholderia kirstenboschensis]CAD6560470.1 hypothetical protein LMG28727_07159 [Paraburkholderia kirstenboschensis]
MSKLSQIVSPDADLAEQRNFFDAVKSNACVRLALKISAMRAALAEADGARGVLAEHAARGVVGEVALCESLAAEVSALSGIVSEAQMANAGRADPRVGILIEEPSRQVISRKVRQDR